MDQYPDEIIQEILLRCDIFTNIELLSLSKHISRLSYDKSFWCAKAEYFNVCKPETFDEFCNIIYKSKLESSDISEILNYIKSHIVLSNNLELIDWYSGYRRALLILVDKERMTIDNLLINSMASTYNLMYQMNYDYLQPGIKSIDLNNYPIYNQPLLLYEYLVGYYDIIIEISQMGMCIIMSYIDGDILFREFKTNYVFLLKNTTLKFLGKLSENKITESVNHQEKQMIINKYNAIGFLVI